MSTFGRYISSYGQLKSANALFKKQKENGEIQDNGRAIAHP